MHNNFRIDEKSKIDKIMRERWNAMDRSEGKSVTIGPVENDHVEGGRRGPFLHKAVYMMSCRCVRASRQT